MEQNIFYANEEDVSTEEAFANAAREHTAQYRIAIDPIDGTGNYSGDKRPGKVRQPVNRSLDDLTDDELNAGQVRVGWGSIVTIQERQADNSWKTVVSGIYESNGADMPEDIKGKFFLADADRQGVSVIDLQTGEEKSVIVAPGREYLTLVIEGGFPDVPAARQAQTAMREYVTAAGHRRTNLRCVAQSVVGLLTGRAQAYFQGHSDLYDAPAMLHLAESAGFYAMALDKNGDEPAVSIDKDGTSHVQYPAFLATTPEFAIGMAEAFIQGAGLHKDQLTFRNGQWEEKSFERIKDEMRIRASADNYGMTAVPEPRNSAGRILPLIKQAKRWQGSIAKAIERRQQQRKERGEGQEQGPQKRRRRKRPT